MNARHLLAIEGRSRAQIEALLERAGQFREGRVTEKHLFGRTVANLFFEPSTRTRSSFEIAAAELGAHVLNWTVLGSSASKGETLIDTAKNLAAMGPVAMVVRHPSAGAAQLVAQHVSCAVINAGDGQHEHPSQALLDAFTLRRRFGSLEGKVVAIVGDVLHSRVARSNLHCLKLLGASVILVGPPTLVPRALEAFGAELVSDLDAVLPRVDALMMLRLQTERMTDAFIPGPEEYRRRFGLDSDRVTRLKASAVVLHPGPVNRGLEIAPEVADGPRSLILEQVANGVAVRKAILEVLT